MESLTYWLLPARFSANLSARRGTVCALPGCRYTQNDNSSNAVVRSSRKEAELEFWRHIMGAYSHRSSLVHDLARTRIILRRFGPLQISAFGRNAMLLYCSLGNCTVSRCGI